MGDERRGRKRRVSDEEILEVFRQTDDPVLIASEIAEHVGLSRRAVNYRLKKLSDEGILDSKQVANRTVAWWLPGHTET